MKNIIQYSTEIKKEADHLLYNKGLNQILKNYGLVKFTGSYELDLMVKKDLDITLLTNNISLTDFYKLGGEMSVLLNPHSMFFRNTKVKPVNNRPKEGYYWGVQFEDWKLDLWAIEESKFNGSVRYIDGIIKKLTPENKEIILDLKFVFMNDKEYGSKFSSKEVYEAVLNYGVKTKEEFYVFLSGRNSLPEAKK